MKNEQRKLKIVEKVASFAICATTLTAYLTTILMCIVIIANSCYVPQKVDTKNNNITCKQNFNSEKYQKIVKIKKDEFNQKAQKITKALNAIIEVAEEKQRQKEYDKELLAHLMYGEEGILLSIKSVSDEDAKEAHMLAGSVVLNRKNMNYGGAQTVEEVIFAKNQYQCIEAGYFYMDVPNIVYEWAEELLENGPIGPENMVFQSQFTQGSGTYKKIYNQYFCVL